MERQPPAMAGDLLYGADEIAEYLFGSKAARRRVYTLDAAGALPTFRLAGKLCGRKSAIADTIAARETAKAPRLASSDEEAA
jgi:hypothetical protein